MCVERSHMRRMGTRRQAAYPPAYATLTKPCRERRRSMKNALRKDDQASERGSAHRLTDRQGQILNLVSLGHTNREIAILLKISVRTVEVHRFQLMRRLNVRNVAQLLRRALQLGFLSSADMRPQMATPANASVVELPLNGKSRKLLTTRSMKP
jgi:DNA-binding CsgD family transcriptional regulator